MFYDSFLSPSSGTFYLRENTDLLKKAKNTYSRLSCEKKLLKSWQLQLHELPGQDHTCPSMTYLSILPLCHAAMFPPSTHLPNAAHRSTARQELSFHALLNENAIKVQALLTLSNSSLIETMLLQRL